MGYETGDSSDAEEIEACAKVAERRGLTPWIVENALYRFKIGDKLPMHMLDVVQEVKKESEAQGE